ncbi:MAG: histidine kinase [Chitinophagales bacterium]
MIRLLILVAYCLLAIPLQCLQAQSYSSVHYDTKDGLPSATVYDITQDKNGFIWFGTENGLCRFDGKNFRTYTTKDGLPDNSILKVNGDNLGRVYFSPFTHSLHYYQNDSFFKFDIPGKYMLDLGNMSAMYNQKNKVILTGSLSSYMLENDSLLSFNEKYIGMPKEVLVHRVYDTLIIAGSLDSLYFIGGSGTVRSTSHDFNNNLIFDDAARQHYSNITKASNFKMTGYLTGNLLYWLWDNVLNIFNASTGKLIHKIYVEKFSKSFIDNENNLWVTTLGNGVYRFPSFNFRNMDFDGKNEIFSLTKIDKQLIAGTDFSTVYSIPIQKNHGTYTKLNFFEFIAASDNTTANLTKRNRIYALRSEGNDLYIGADAFLLKKTGSSAPVFRKIFPVKDIDLGEKEILVCTGKDVVLLTKQGLSISDTLLRQRSTCGVIYQDDYYIGTLGGLIKISSTNKTTTALYNLFPSFRGRITALKKGINDDLWVATSGSGLIHFKNGKIIKTLKEKEDGLTSDICTALYIDSNLVWLGTNKGLNRIETGKEKMVITRVTSANGLGADFIDAVLATDSIVYVGTAAGLTIFNKKILTEKSICLLHILQVSENNVKLKKDNSYTFPHNALNMKIDFTAISFKSAGDITYSYQLQGLDQTWNTTTANFVNFPSLQPRKYTLHLKAINKFGVESETKSIHITVLPAWWQTWFFRIIALSVFGLLILLLYRYNIRNVKRKEVAKREIESRFAALEQRALQAQMNPHFIFNALNSIQTFILNLDVEGANTYLTRFASLIRQTLENSMQPFITVASELKYLETYLGLEKLRFRDKFEYKIHIDGTIDQNNTLLPGMLLQPYIENSIRHGIQHRKDNNGLISLSINKTSDNSIIYTIKDNGVGRKKAEEFKSSRHIEYQSRGMFINSKRIAAMNNQFRTNIRVNIEDLADEDESAGGTSVTILIPPLEKPPA